MVEAKGKKPKAKNPLINAKELKVDPITSFKERENLRKQGNKLREKLMMIKHQDKEAFKKDLEHAANLEIKKGVQKVKQATLNATGKHEEKKLNL